MSLEEHERRDRAQAIGLFRYRLICPTLDGGLSSRGHQRHRVRDGVLSGVVLLDRFPVGT